MKCLPFPPSSFRLHPFNDPSQFAELLIEFDFSLTPKSFQLNLERPTVQIAATVSKHRREDVVPLHPHLVGIVREMVQTLEPDEPLFPKLATRKTWLMVKNDLKAAGIPYKTHEGYADFHAAGRHTFITSLLRNGVSLPEARELARHTDIRMTMKYTHIGHEEQARALAKLQSPIIDVERSC